MSILIKGMQMPSCCEKCAFKDYEQGFCFASSGYDESGWPKPTLYVGNVEETCRHNECPLVSVPPHGRCIDADALMLKILDYIEEYSDVDEKGWHNLKWCAMKEAEMAINDAPTVIPAEEE